MMKPTMANLLVDRGGREFWRLRTRPDEIKNPAL